MKQTLLKRYGLSSRLVMLAGVLTLVSGCDSRIRDNSSESPYQHQVKAPYEFGVASAHPLATAAGIKVLEEGGNAYDAAVTVAAVLAVVEPFGSGLGGGGFWLLHDEQQNRSVFVDGREKAPLAATETMYQKADGSVDRELATNHPLAAAIPGTPAAMVHVQQKYGHLSLKRLLQPAVDLADKGFAVTAEYTDALQMQLAAVQKWPSSSGFLDHGQLPKPGWILKQPDLAHTLRQIAEKGRQGFYEGEVAEKMVKSVQQNGGIWTLKDLAQYNVEQREPVVFNYGDYTVTSSPLPSSGGLVMAGIFGQLERLDYQDASEADRTHLFIEAMRNAYYKRAQFMGDPDFTHDNGLWMLKKAEIDEMASHINSAKARPSSEMPLLTSGSKGAQTTHFSVMDAEGNRAAVTLSINLYFGTGFTAQNTGVLLNNEMDDFSAQPGSPNAYGLVGSEANKIEPGKRPLSSMTPTFVEGPNGVYVLGTPGGSRIISMVSWGVLAAIDGDTPQEMAAKPRIHHQYLPDIVEYEKGALSDELKTDLMKRGHELQQTSRPYGDLQVIYLNETSHKMSGGSDPRGEGVASVEEVRKP